MSVKLSIVLLELCTLFFIFCQVLETAKTARTLFPYVSLIDPRTTHISAILCSQMVTQGFDTCIAYHQNAYIGAVFELMTGRNLWFGSMFVSDLSIPFVFVWVNVSGVLMLSLPSVDGWEKSGNKIANYFHSHSLYTLESLCPIFESIMIYYCLWCFPSFLFIWCSMHCQSNLCIL